MNVLLIYRGKEAPLAYPTLVDDLARHGVNVTTASINVLGILLPTVIARKLRHGNFDVVACASENLLTNARLAIQFNEDQAVTAVEWPSGQSVANLEVVRKPSTQNICLVTDIADARKAVTAFAKTAPDDMRLRVLGTAKARMIMPVVQLCRKHRIEDRIDWLGDDYVIDDELATCRSFYAGNRPLNNLEASLSAAGVPCVDPEDLSKSTVRTDWESGAFHVKHILESLRKQ